jgi:hypothetical protein
VRAGLALATVLFASVAGAARPNTPGGGALFRYGAGDVVESFDSAGGNFRVFYTRAGGNAVPLADANVDGVPDHVEETAALYEEVLAFYQGLGFRRPMSDATVPGDNGGDARFDVYLLDFAGSADGSFQREGCDGAGHCAGYIVQENDFAGYGYPNATVGNRVLSSHELFHAVQAAYDNDETTIVGEGTAVWATERFDPTLHDLEGFAGGYLSRPDRSLYLPLPGPVDAFSYGSGIFFQFLSERFGDAIIRQILESTEGGEWFAALDGVLAMHQSRFADAFFEFARWNLYTKARQNPQKSYARGGGFPLVRVDAQSVPAQVMALRIFPASSIYLGLSPAGRARLEASVFFAPGAADTAPLRLALAPRQGNQIGEPVLADATLRAAIDGAGADEVVLLLSNTATSGESLRPSVCIGDAAEVAACRAALGAVDEPPPMTPMGGCTLGGAAAGWPAVLLLAIAAALLRRRRYPARGRTPVCSALQS